MQLPDHIVHPVIETPRLLLKELNPDVLVQLFTTCTDDQIIAFLGLASNEELETEKNIFNKGLTTYRLSFKNFLIVEKELGKVIGRAGYHTWYLLHDRAEIGYALSADEYKNKGYMKEALTAIYTHGFEEMKLNRIEALVGRMNEPSLKLVKHFGFTEEGTLREHYKKNGEMQDSICFGLLRSEYDVVKGTW